MKTRCMVLKTAIMVIVPIFLFISILVSPFSNVYATGTIVGIECAENIEEGSVFILSIYLENAINTTGVGLDLIWNPKVLILHNVSVSASAPAGTAIWASKINNDVGSLEIALANMNPPDYITVIEETRLMDLMFKAIGSPSNSTTLELENVELSDEYFDLYFPDMVVDGSVSIQTPEIISINVDFSDIDFGTMFEGGSGTSLVNITNDGNVEVSITATLGSEVPDGFYTSNFRLNGLVVSDWSISTLGIGASEIVVLSLDIPVDSEPRFKTAILTFWTDSSQ